MAFLAVDLDVPGGLLDEAVDHAQAEPGARARAFRGEERVEDLIQQGRGDAGSGVADCDQRVGTRPDVAMAAGIAFVEIGAAGFEHENGSITPG